MVTIIFLGLVLVGYFAFMKFYYPKMKAKYETSQKEFDEEWGNNKDQIMKDYLTDMNRFGLISQATQDEEIIGICSASLGKSMLKSLTSSAVEGLKSAITLTSKVDMSKSYLVATDKGLHYMSFDGEKCIVNEVFQYREIIGKEFSKEKFNFIYKNDKIQFNVSEMISGYPRFNIHERFREPTKQDRSLNYFVREYVAYEHTNNMRFKQTEPGFAKYKFQTVEISKENLIDLEVRKVLLDGFKKKLGV
ncbi:MAG: hypothetical protein KGV44_04685 [Flavobacteriaceae bacterium]|nr:hypothetical protein [Flavobacteriaceae bacterium]